jgi:hypothetical protein
MTQITTKADELTRFYQEASERSLSKRRLLFEQFLDLNPESQPMAANILLTSAYKDMREAVLEYCTSDVVSSVLWQTCIEACLDDAKFTQNMMWCQCVLVLMQRIEGELSDKLSHFCRQMLDASDVDVRYQAFCLAELACTNDADYVSRVRVWAEDSDEDFRIVAIQAIARLQPEWGMEVLERRASVSFGVEAFHILLTQIRLSSAEDRERFIEKLIPYVGDERFSFAAIQTLSEYGNERAVPALLKVAKSFLSEPTVRVAAAGAAAKLGSEKGRKILLKFATSGHGNPKYAEELLDALDGKAVKSLK